MTFELTDSLVWITASEIEQAAARIFAGLKVNPKLPVTDDWPFELRIELAPEELVRLTIDEIELRFLKSMMHAARDAIPDSPVRITASIAHIGTTPVNRRCILRIIFTKATP